MSHSATLCSHLGRAPDDHYGAVNIPPYFQSTRVFKNRAELEQCSHGDIENPAYGTDGTPTTIALMRALAELEGAHQAWLAPSGLTAITCAMLAVLKTGDHVLVPDNAYGPTKAFGQSTLARMGVEVEVYDPMLGGEIARLFRPETSLVVVESPGSITMEVQDIPAIAAAAHAHGALVMADSTWAAPLLWKPFELGVDISVWEGTKYLGGHADVLLGVISAKNPDICKKINQQHMDLGLCVNGMEAYLALRGLRTLPIRMKQHQESALTIARWLEKHPLVERVLHPALASCLGHEHWQRDFSGSNGLLSFLIPDIPKTAIASMLDSRRLFRQGYSWGGFESLMLAFKPSPLRTVTRWGHTGWLIRIHVGLEDLADILSDLEDGLAKLMPAPISKRA